MKFFRESILLLSIYFVSEIISKLLNLPVPGSIIGMILLFVLLTSNIIKIEKVENLANFFLDHLAFFFIPASVGLMTSFASLKGSIFKIILLCILTTIIVISVTGLTVQFICNRKSIKEVKKNKINKKGA
ncbi:MAG: CidA/LrgA family protein [Clostridium sp.]|uniref:CidA/LrgA family protein n=1 Tax=Clostridium saudiense TaxID=1414720 RepID=A0ABS2FDQ4_9CLOT|nr:CidA/LrgA family protein [Clostridium saudiense]MBM6818182.1 CidA/LrgA family protein [Clostridium saudiense]MBQ9000119.1 CidA/LrgA family protein [Clostridium sp.]